VPPSITGAEKTFLEQQETSLNARYALVREVWEATPGCDPGEAACRPDWRALGAKFKAMYQSERGGRGPRCGGPRYGSGSVAAREREHSRYLSKLVDEVDAHLLATADAYSPKSAQEWLRLAANAKEQPPMPCLSCTAPEFSEMTDSVPFEKDSSSLPADASRLSSIVGTYRSNRVPVKVVVRGHADAKEPKAAELAKARANAVAAWLEKNGIPKDRIEIRSLDASLPVGRSETEEGAALNRRVDFEAVRL
jgi:outer membrane protein OmpA-like peptidoglycan-associated protein